MTERTDALLRHLPIWPNTGEIWRRFFGGQRKTFVCSGRGLLGIAYGLQSSPALSLSRFMLVACGEGGAQVTMALSTKPQMCASLRLLVPFALLKVLYGYCNYTLDT